MDFLGSTYRGFAKMARLYNQARAMAKFGMHFYHKFERNERTTNRNGDVIDIPTKLYVRDMASYNNKYALPEPMLPVSETIQSFKLPYITEQITITPDMLQQRMARMPYDTEDREMVSATRMLAEEYAHLVDKINRRKELSAIQALVDGEIVDGESKKIISFPQVATHQVSPSNEWNDLSQSDPIKDIDNLCFLLHADGGTKDYEVYMGIEAFEYFIQNPKVKDKIQILDRGLLEPIIRLEDKSEYVNTWGIFTTPRGNRITIKQYTEIYDTFEDGVRNGSKYFFPEKKVLIIAKGAPLQLGIGRPPVMRPNSRSNYDYKEIDDTIVTLKTEETGIYLTVRHCGAPLIPYMNRLGTIKAIS